MLGMTQRTGLCMQLHFGVCNQEPTGKEFREAYHQQDIKGMLTHRPNINAFSIADWSETCSYNTILCTHYTVILVALSRLIWLFSHLFVGLTYKHNCVLSNASLSNAQTKTGICTSLKSDVYFRFHSPLNTNPALLNFICTWDLVLICWKMWSPEPEKCRNLNPHTSKIVKLLPVCLTNNRCRSNHISERMQNFLKIGKEL